MPVGVQADQRRVAHRVGRAEHQLIARTDRVGHRGRDMQPGFQRMRLELVAHRVDRMLVDLGAALQPGRIRLAGGHRTGAGGLRVPRDIGPARARGQGEHRDGRIGQQRRHRPVQRRAAEHDDLLRADQPQRERVQRVVRGRRGRLGDGRQPGQVGMHTRAVPRDDDGVGRQVDVERLVERDRRRVRPRLAAGTALGEIAGAGAHVVLDVGHQRLAQRDVELHRARIGRPRSGGGHQHSAGRRAPLCVERVHPIGRFLGQAEADVGAHLRAEVTQLLERLIGAGAQQLVGPVGAQHDQRHPRVVGLHYGRAEVGHRGARRHRHTHRRALGDREPDRQEAGGAFVDAHMQSDPAGPVGVLQRECQRSVSRTRA